MQACAVVWVCVIVLRVCVNPHANAFVDDVDRPELARARHVGSGINICLASLEFQGIANGGIGTAMAELANALAKLGHNVTVAAVYGGGKLPDQKQARRTGVQIIGVNYRGLQATNESPYDATSTSWPQLASFRLYQWLKHRQSDFHVVMYHEWSGIGFYIAQAKSQGLHFQDLALVGALHGPHLWAMHNQRNALSSVNDLEIDFMERRSIERADYVIAPSQYIVDYVRGRGWNAPTRDALVLANPLAMPNANPSPTREMRVQEVVFFGKTSHHKGIDIFCDAIDILLGRYKTLAHLHITFLVRFERIDGMEGDEWLRQRGLKWKAAGAHLKLKADLNTEECRAYLR